MAVISGLPAGDCVSKEGRARWGPEVPVVSVRGDSVELALEYRLASAAARSTVVQSGQSPSAHDVISSLTGGHSLVALLTVPALSGKRSARDGEPEGQKGRRKHIKQQPGGTKDDVTMGGTSSEQKGIAKGANKSTDAKLHNAVLKTLCVLSQQVREVSGAVFMCWMIKQEAPVYKKTKEQLRAYSELAAFTGLLRALSERGSAVGAANAAGVANFKEGSETGGGIRYGTSLQAGQSVRSSSEPSRTRHQRGTTPRTHS